MNLTLGNVSRELFWNSFEENMGETEKFVNSVDKVTFK